MSVHLFLNLQPFHSRTSVQVLHYSKSHLAHAQLRRESQQAIVSGSCSQSFHCCCRDMPPQHALSIKISDSQKNRLHELLVYIGFQWPQSAGRVMPPRAVHRASFYPPLPPFPSLVLFTCRNSCLESRPS